MKLIWYTVLIRAIPETLGLIILSLAVVREKRGLKEIFLTSVICGLIGFTMRMLPLKFGIHMLLVVIIEAIVMNIILKIKLQKAFIGILVSLATLNAAEIATISLAESVLKIDLQTLFSTASGTLLAGLPSVIALYIIAYIVYKFTNRKYSNENSNYVN